MSANEELGAFGQIPSEQKARRAFAVATPPSDRSGAATAATTAAIVTVLFTWFTLLRIWSSLESIQAGGVVVAALLVGLAVAVTALFAPVIVTWRESRTSRERTDATDLVHARIASMSASEHANHTFAYAFLVWLALLLAHFVIANDLAVGRTFFFLPLMADTFWLILKAFWVNVYIFVIAEVFVLIWGLVVAVARLLPGEPARPVRAIAIVYADVFRGMPAIITIYLVGFGIPLTGIPVLKDFSPQFYAILALTLTYGAYVSEVYRSGIESIHWSQVAGARSLGLSYFQTLRHVVVPQAVRRIVPPLLNDFIGLQKDTALVNVIGALDAFNQAKIIASNHFNLSPVTTVAVLFVLITIPQARFVDKLIERDQRRTRVG